MAQHVINAAIPQATIIFKFVYNEYLQLNC